MHPLTIPQDRAAPLKLLLLGAHSDDIEIGCGGTLMHLLAERPRVDVRWVVFSGAGVRAQEARSSAALFLAQAAHSEVQVQQFLDGHFPYQGAQIKACFEALKQDFEPDLVFTHYRNDRHQDHRTISDLTWNTWRHHLILEYEIPKYDGDLGSPNVFVPLDRETCLRKARAICDVFRSESGKAWLREETFMGLARLRGIECAAPRHYAEAFYGRKVSLGL